jgi:hypothetical protein
MMMSKKSWMKALTALELLPILAATSLIAYAQENTPKAPEVQPSSAPSAVPSATPSAAPSVAPSATPSPAPSASPSPSLVRSAPYELSLSQASKMFKGLHIEVARVDANDPKSQIREVTLRGKIHKDCVDHFSIKNPLSDGFTGNTIGFTIVDDGGGLACVDEHKGEACTNSTCVSLVTQYEGATMDTSTMPADGNVKLIHTDPEGDGDAAIKMEDLKSSNGQAVYFQSADTLAKIKADAEKAARDARNDRNEDLFKNCRHSLEELSIATKALNALIRDSDMAIEDIRSSRAELSQAKEALLKKKVQDEFKLLQKRIAKIKDSDDAESVSEDIAQFADDHPEFATAARRAQLDLVNTVEESMGNSPESFGLRKQIYQNLIGMDGVSAAEAKSYRVKMTGLDIAQQAMSYQAGNIGNMNYYGMMQGYQQMMQAAQKDYKNSCQATKTNALSDACAQSMKNIAAAQQLPQLANAAMRQQQQEQIQQQNMQFQMQMQMQQYMNSTMNVGVQGAQMPGLMSGMPPTNGMSAMNGMSGMNGMRPPGAF